VLEPTNAFFATVLHREALFLFSEALVLLALVRMWERGIDRRALACAGAGLLLCYGARSYVATFVAVAVLATLVAIALRRRLGASRAVLATLALGAVAGAGGIVLAPHVVAGELAKLQAQLNAPYPGFSNLQLPHTSVLTSSGILHTVTTRSLDLVSRPYLWQLGSTAQKAGVLGTLIWYVLVVGVLVLAVKSGPRLSARAAPILFLVIAVAIGFSLTLVNAGEGFRHRINLVLPLAAAAGYLLAARLNAKQAKALAGDDLQKPVTPAAV
jgi:hypothetical protein